LTTTLPTLICYLLTTTSGGPDFTYAHNFVPATKLLVVLANLGDLSEVVVRVELFCNMYSGIE